MATGKTFQFRAPQNLLPHLKLGQRVGVDNRTLVVSVEGALNCCKLVQQSTGTGVVGSPAQSSATQRGKQTPPTQPLQLTQPAPDVFSMTLNPTSVPGGAEARGTVGPVPQTARINLSSSNPSVASVAAAAVRMVRGRGSANFTVTTYPVLAPADVNISASFSGQTKTMTLRVVPPAPLALASVSLNLSSVTGCCPLVTGTVTLTGPAPAVGVVRLFSNSPAATVPGSIQIAAGSAQASFNVATNPVAAPINVTITARSGGGSYEVIKYAHLAVAPAPVALDKVGFPVSPYPSFSVVTYRSGGQSVSAKVILTGPATSDGAAVALSSSNQAVAQVPGFVQVSGGTPEVSFTVPTTPVATDTPVTISASYAGQTKTATLTVARPRLEKISLNPTSIIGGAPVVATVVTYGGAVAPAGGLVVSLSSNHPTAASAPTTVTIPAGASTVSFPVTTNPVAAPTDVNISASTSGDTRTTILKVVPPALKELGLNPTTASFQAGTVDAWVSLNGPAPAGAAVLLSWTSTAAATVPSSVPVAAGATTASFKVTLKQVSAPTPFTLSAYYRGVTKTGTLTVNP